MTNSQTTATNVRIGQGAKVHKALTLNGKILGAACNYDGFTRRVVTTTTDPITCAKCAK